MTTRYKRNSQADEGTDQKKDLQIVSLELLTPTACRDRVCVVPLQFNLGYTFLSGVAREKKLPSKNRYITRRPANRGNSIRLGWFWTM